MAVTTLSNLVNPQVVADTLTAQLPAAIKFSPICEVNKDLVGTPGNTISVPKYAYIGDAVDVAEGGEITATTLTATSAQATVKKAGKGVTITDEAALSGTGDPINEATNQLKLSIASKVDNDIMASAQSSSNVITGEFSNTFVSDAVDELEEEEVGERKFLFVPPVFMGILRTDPTWTHASELGDKTLMTGCVGMVYGCEVIPTKRITADSSDVYKCVLAKEGAVALYLKRDVNVETGRDITHKTTLITADEHYVTALRDENRCIVLKAKLPTAVKTRKAALKPTSSEPSQGSNS